MEEEQVLYTFCQKEQPIGEAFFTICPKGVLRRKTFWDECLATVGGKQEAEDFILDAYVRKTRNLFDHFRPKS